MEAVERIGRSLDAVRERAPLVHNITNYVVMNSTANALLAVGASPAMIHAPDEVEEFVGISQALVVNIGTLSSPWVAAMKLAVARATAMGVPWVLDPVGAGATGLRTRTAMELAPRAPAVIRANGSEIMALAGMAGTTARGVDSAVGSEEALDAAGRLARELGTVVAVTGPVDYVTDGDRVAAIANGHPLMARVTGMGCTASALVGAFRAVESSAFVAATAALAVLGVAGEMAAERAAGPGSLQMHLFDSLHTLDREALTARLRLS